MKNYIEQIARIRNTLYLVEAKGDSLLTMADCLRAIDDLIENMEQEATQNEIIRSNT